MIAMELVSEIWASAICIGKNEHETSVELVFDDIEWTIRGLFALKSAHVSPIHPDITMVFIKLHYKTSSWLIILKSFVIMVSL